MTKGFIVWLRAQDKRDDPVGDLARDFKADGRARGIRTLAALTEHLLRCDACEGALDSLVQAGAEWSREQQEE